MVERGQLAAPYSAVAVGTLVVAGIVQAFADGTPLHGEVVVVVERRHLVNRPREGAVVNDDARLLALPDGVGSVVHVLLLASAAAYEAYDDVVAYAVNGVVAQRNARVGSRLARNGGVRGNAQVRVEGDDAAHVKHDGSGP